MKPSFRASFFHHPHALLLLFILPYVILSSCSEPGVTVAGMQQVPQPNPVTGELPLSSQQGMLKLKINYKDGRVFTDFCWIVQAGMGELATVRRFATPEISLISLENVSTITVTKWAPETFWGRIITGLNVSDSMCCSSVRYSLGKWYFESLTDTIITSPQPNRIISCVEKCPF